MENAKEYWELMILDGKSEMRDTGSLGAADIDGDGRQELFVGGSGGLVWYRPDTFEKGLISSGSFQVAMALEDIDGDGRPELFVGEESGTPGRCSVTWYKPGRSLNDPWERHVVDPVLNGGNHDLLFADLDNDGENELIAVIAYSSTPGIYAYKRGKDVTAPWRKYTVGEGVFTDGVAVGDLDGDGRIEIVCGPDWYVQPEDGPFSGPWKRNTYAPDFREMCRVAVLDITGNGRPDIVITDSEYMDGYLSWFENRLVEDPANPWIEHRLENGMIYSHSLDVRYDPASRKSLIFVAEMDAGGWNAPYNLDARLMTYTSKDFGRTWEREILYQGEGTHQAILYDIDGDGELEVLGKTCSQVVQNVKVQIWKRKAHPTLNVSFKHRFLDRDKPNRAIEIMAADVNGDGRPDVVCGSYWYRNPDWKRYDIPGIFQVFNHYDIDRDGREEFIALKWDQRYLGNDYMGLMSGDLWWIKPTDPENGKWEEHYIGRISGDWTHGSTVAPLLPGGRLALITCYHNSQENGNPPEIFEIPDDPASGPWPKRAFADVRYNEELIPFDIDGDGTLDVVAGQYWFDNQGDGTFKAYLTDEHSKAARIGISDINGDGRTDVVVAQEDMDYPNKVIPFSQLFWLETPEDPTQVPWKRHVIDVVRCAHSLGVADIDGDGEDEIIVGEHDPFWPYRKRCRLMAYKKANAQGTAWYRYLIDGRFEHHDGAKVFEIEPGRFGILSHGWEDKIYVNLWEVIKG